MGNYLGALKNWAALQNEYDCTYCVVDMHAITVRQDPAQLRKRCLDVLALLIACGIDPDKNTLFCQSHVGAHAELTWILSCFTYMGELNRMTQFKDKAARHQDNLNAGLYTYPVLMASDILLYNADLVPVGEDQKQHLELTRDIAIRMNNAYGDLFVVPEPYIGKAGARIMSLQDPAKKMSKSDENPNGFIALLDDPAVIRSKIKKAVTDSDGEIRLSPDKPGVSNLLSIYAALMDKQPEDVVGEFHGLGYGALKEAVTDAVLSHLEPLQKTYREVRADKALLNTIMEQGRVAAGKVAYKTLWKVQKKIGFAPRKI